MTANQAPPNFNLETSIPGLLTDKEDLLPRGFGYLLVLNEDVSIVHLYPWLGQLLFGSRAIEVGDGGERTPGSVNLVGIFVDDEWQVLRDNLALAEGRSPTDPDEPLDHRLRRAAPTAARMDTFGDFAKTDPLERYPEEEEEHPPRPADCKRTDWWLRQRLAGSGNPMAMFRFVRQLSGRRCQGDLNVFLLNSLSNLYRNIGLAETAAFLKAVLNEAIWDIKLEHGFVQGTDGLFFAVLQKSVMREEEFRYLASFFDGRVDFRMLEDGREQDEEEGRKGQRTSGSLYRLPSFEVRVLPRVVHAGAVPRRHMYMPARRAASVSAGDLRLEEVPLVCGDPDPGTDGSSGDPFPAVQFIKVFAETAQAAAATYDGAK